MGLPLPKLDDRTYSGLVEEARALIPAYAPRWTDHNASDPGITLVELFAWLAEMLVYRADQLPASHVVTFLRLLNGPEEWDWNPPPDADASTIAALLDEEVRATVRRLRITHRAVSCDDFVELALKAPSEIAVVRQAHCVPRRHLAASVDADRPGHLTVLVVPQRRALADRHRPLTDEELRAFRADVRRFLMSRRVLTTQVHVVSPAYAPVRVDLLVARHADVPEAEVEDQVRTALRGFLTPLAGEQAETAVGWTFGRNVFVAEIVELLERLPGVDYLPVVELTSRCPPDVPNCVLAAELWHEDGDQIGLELGTYQLPQLDEESRLYLAAQFVAVSVVVDVRPDPSTPPARVRKDVKAAIRRFFHPAHGGPTGAKKWGPTPVTDLGERIVAVPGVVAVESLEISTAPQRIATDEFGTARLLFEERELVDVQTMVDLG